MSFLGKILTGLICIASLFMMWVSINVYATHKNWKAEAEKLKSNLSQATASNAELESRLQSLQTTLTAEAEDLRRQAVKLETERTTLLSLNNTLQNDLDQLRQKQRANTAAVASTQANNEKLTEEVASLRSMNLENQEKRDQAFRIMIAATDNLHQAKGRLDSLEERNVQLVAELGQKRVLLNENGINPDTDPESVVPQVRGQVFATRRNAGSQLIEVSIGSDDGLKPGHTVEVFRGDRYLGRAEILTTEPDRAVGRVIRRFQQGQIQEGDNVATKLRIG